MSNFCDTQQAERHTDIFFKINRFQWNVSNSRCVCVVAHSFGSNLNHFTEKLIIFSLDFFIGSLSPLPDRCAPFCEKTQNVLMPFN